MENIKNETRTNYAELGVLAHEIGHHLSGYTLTNVGSRYDSELEADKFAGFILYKLGATITEVKQCYSNLSSAGSSSHPPKSARIAAVSSGYYDAKRDGVSIQRATSNNTTTLRNNDTGGTIKIGRLEVMETDLMEMETGKGHMHWHKAKKACARLGDGWRLPTKEELMILYENKDIIGGFINLAYWSSSEAGFVTYSNFGRKYCAWIQSFKYGKQNKTAKEMYRCRVRPVRDF